MLYTAAPSLGLTPINPRSAPPADQPNPMELNPPASYSSIPLSAIPQCFVVPGTGFGFEFDSGIQGFGGGRVTPIGDAVPPYTFPPAQ